MPLTLKQAVAHLATTDNAFKLPTLRKAIQSGQLKSRLVTTDMQAYRVVELDDLMAWATNKELHLKGFQKRSEAT